MAIPSRLPNAPLAEVVFEMRWRLVGADGVPPPFCLDPGYFVLADRFAHAAQRSGFSVVREVRAPHEILAHVVAHRFYRSSDRNFPLWQIGPGLFAANESTEYEWSSYKQHVLEGARSLVSSYPQMHGFSIRPNRLELRYINIFDRTLVNTVDPIEFANHALNLTVIQPERILEAVGKLEPINSARVAFTCPIKQERDTTLQLEYGSAVRHGEPVVRMEQRIVKEKKDVIAVKRGERFLRDLGAWLERAHNVTSPLFRSVVQAEVLEKFK